jgi:hypothetical protein
MNKLNEKQFFSSPFISKLSKYKKQLEILRKMQISNTTTKAVRKSIIEKPKELIDNKKHELAESEKTTYLLSEKSVNTVSKKGTTMMTLPEHNGDKTQKSSSNESEIAEFKRKQKQEEIKAKIADAERIKAKSLERQKNELEQARQEKVNMQQFLNDFVESVKGEKA